MMNTQAYAHPHQTIKAHHTCPKSNISHNKNSLPRPLLQIPETKDNASSSTVKALIKVQMMLMKKLTTNTGSDLKFRQNTCLSFMNFDIILDQMSSISKPIKN